MSKLFTGSICLTDLLDKASSKHSAFIKSQKNGKVYANILIWENDKVDNFGNTHSLQLNSTKENKVIEAAVYIGNAKPVESKAPQPISSEEAKKFTEVKDDLPF